MVEPFSLNFRMFTVKLVGVQKLKNFMVNMTNMQAKFTDPPSATSLGVVEHGPGTGHIELL